MNVNGCFEVVHAPSTASSASLHHQYPAEHIQNQHTIDHHGLHQNTHPLSDPIAPTSHHLLSESPSDVQYFIQPAPSIQNDTIPIHQQHEQPPHQQDSHAADAAAQHPTPQQHAAMDSTIDGAEPWLERPSLAGLSRAQEFLTSLELVLMDSTASPTALRNAEEQSRRINDWINLATEHIIKCREVRAAIDTALNATDHSSDTSTATTLEQATRAALDRVDDFLTVRQQSFAQWIVPTEVPVSRPCFRTRNQDPEDIILITMLQDNSRCGTAYKLFRKDKKTIYGDIRLGVACSPGADGVFVPQTEKVAVKVYDVGRMVERKHREGQSLLEDGIREITAQRYLASPGHANVQPLLSCLHDQTKIYVVQERALRSIMDDLVQRSQRVSTELGACQGYSIQRTQRIFTQLASGLSYIHNCGIAHRDVSLENSLLFAGDHARIIDLGLCVPLTLAADDGSGCNWMHVNYQQGVGKPRYMAPEVLIPTPEISASGVYDACSSDVWSLGCCLYCLLFNQPPYEAASAMCVRFADLVLNGVLTEMRLNVVVHMTGSATQPQDVDRCVQGLRLLQRMLCVDVDKRITMEDVLKDPFCVGVD